ncbi:hypothetical protein BC830DRAFT_38140 [Chytriomyces sp. MP71]|nr:hypothetical protein BC830DRAFT_38140 [Chytriomyces sp. MP71]
MFSSSPPSQASPLPAAMQTERTCLSQCLSSWLVATGGCSHASELDLHVPPAAVSRCVASECIPIPSSASQPNALDSILSDLCASVPSVSSPVLASTSPPVAFQSSPNRSDTTQTGFASQPSPATQWITAIAFLAIAAFLVVVGLSLRRCSNKPPFRKSTFTSSDTTSIRRRNTLSFKYSFMNTAGERKHPAIEPYADPHGLYSVFIASTPTLAAGVWCTRSSKQMDSDSIQDDSPGLDAHSLPSHSFGMFSTPTMASSRTLFLSAPDNRNAASMDSTFVDQVLEEERDSSFFSINYSNSAGTLSSTSPEYTAITPPHMAMVTRKKSQEEDAHVLPSIGETSSVYVDALASPTLQPSILSESSKNSDRRKMLWEDLKWRSMNVLTGSKGQC